MEKSASNDRPLLKTVMIIASINLVFTAVMFFGFMIAVVSEMSSSDESPTGAKPLPQELATQEERAELFDKFKLNYNSGNEELLSMYGKAYQLQLEEKGFDEVMKPIRKVASTIDDGAYSHYEFEELGSGLTKFHLYYSIRIPDGLGQLKLSIVQQADNPYELFAFIITTK